MIMQPENNKLRTSDHNTLPVTQQRLQELYAAVAAMDLAAAMYLPTISDQEITTTTLPVTILNGDPDGLYREPGQGSAESQARGAVRKAYDLAA